MTSISFENSLVFDICGHMHHFRHSMTKLLKISTIAAFGLFTVGLYSNPESKIKKIGESTFISDVESALKAFNASGKKRGMIPREMWTDSIKSFLPKYVKNKYVYTGISCSMVLKIEHR